MLSLLSQPLQEFEPNHNPSLVDWSPVTLKRPMGQYAILWLALLQTQASNEAAKAKEAFYQKALQDLTLFKSKTNAALLQVHCKHCLLTVLIEKSLQTSSGRALIFLSPIGI